ncbi:hypothetical protein HDU85_004945 [Gaertneriomyces sp. JEL0708]|nr:hypothetical protein HDU85_004945 [Gaertneriomyces sp. JEL0708]
MLSQQFCCVDRSHSQQPPTVNGKPKRPLAADMQHGDHICFIYETEEEHRQVLTRYVLDGVKNNDKILYIADAHTTDEIKGYFDDHPTVDIAELERKGQCVFITSSEAYLRDGVFIPEAMVAFLSQTADESIAQGYNGMRVTGEMCWIFKLIDCEESYVRYESLVNKLFIEKQVTAVCQYRRDMFESKLLLDLINVHPIACIGSELLDNFYYIPPDDWSKPNKADVFLEYWIKNLRERKAVEEQLVRAKEAADEECRSKTVFLSTMSHEIRTPLNGLIGTAELLKGMLVSKTGRHGVPMVTPTADTVQSLFKTVDICCSHLLSVVNDVLDLSQISRSLPQLSKFSLFGCVDDAVRIVQGQADAKGINLATDLGKDVVDALGTATRLTTDETGLRKVFVNLLGNATKFTPHGGTVSVKVATDGPCPIYPPPPQLDTCPFIAPTGTTFKKIRVTVTDDGVGISSADIHKVFKAFSRVGNGKDENGQDIQGTGLGLSICKQLVSRMGGDIWVKSDGAGKGCEFGFWFWAQVDDCVSVNDAGSSSQSMLGCLGSPVALPLEHADQTAEIPSPLRFLVADDNAINRRILYQFLRSFGYDADAIAMATDGAEAVATCQARLEEGKAMFDVILLDYRMPNLTGAEACARIREIVPAGHPQPVIACLTAAVLEGEKRICLDAGMDDFVHKPLRRDFLKQRLAVYTDLLSRRRQQQQQQHAPATIDSHSKPVTSVSH